jgi:hypothetical protein
MRKNEISNGEIHFSGPPEHREEAVRVLESLGFVEMAPSLPWPGPSSGSLEEPPGLRILATLRRRKGLTQAALSGRTGIPQRHLSEMENGRRPIGKKLARVLGLALETDYRAFL